MDRKQAIWTLQELLKKPGSLRIITAECVSEACTGAPTGSVGHDEGLFKLADPRHFIIHDVVRLEGPNHKGQVRAHSAEGDWCMGQPEALLARLLEASGAGSMAEVPTPRKGLLTRLFGR